MPYIPKKRRKALEKSLAPIKAGELNYLFTHLILNYLELNRISYQSYNDIIGALEGAKLELYARMVRPYEDRKIKENGDVYDRKID